MKRFRIMLPTLGLLVLALGWSVFWWAASSSVGQAIADWYGREREAQRVWACPDQSISGYPFRILLSCANPTFSGLFGGEPAEGSLAGFKAVAQIYQPNNILVDAESPLKVRLTTQNREATLAWSDFRLGVRSAPTALQRASAVLDEPVLTLSGVGSVQARKAEAHIRRSPPSEQERGYDVAVTLTGLKPPALPPLVNGGDINLDLLASASQGEALVAAGPIPRKLEAWRQAGGRLAVTSLKLSQGETKIEAMGDLGLDEAHRLTGTIDIDKAGLQALVARLGMKPDMIELGAAVSPGEPLRKDGPRSVRLRLKDGRVALGPLVLPMPLPRLY